MDRPREMVIIQLPGELAGDELTFIADAAAYLESPSFAIRVANLLGTPIEALTRLFPRGGRQVVQAAVQSAIEAGLAVAIGTLGKSKGEEAPHAIAGFEKRAAKHRRRHTAVAALSGAGGGLFGLPGLVVELPITTTLMLRGIAATARSAGEDLRSPESRLECLAVFSHGARSRSDDAAETSYLAVRLGLADGIRHAAQFVAQASAAQLERALARGGAPVLVRLVASVAARFNVVVTEKMVAQSLPLVGAAGGALVNVAFLQHFQAVARYHFGLRALERRHGAETVARAYARAAAARAEVRAGRYLAAGRS